MNGWMDERVGRCIDGKVLSWMFGWMDGSVVEK